MDNIKDTFLSQLAANLGASEPALRLLISILLGYPLAIFHRYALYGKNTTLQHLFFALTGLSIGFFNYGFDIIHSIICIISIYLILFFIGGSHLSVLLSFVFNMTYLLVGYYYTGTESYDITWSMPHCVLTLRIIGLTFDVYDGQKNQDELSEEQKNTALKIRPSLLEIAGHSYFFGGFMVGPQFPMRRYLSFVQGAFTDSRTGGLPACLVAGLTRGGTGCLYLLLFQIAATLVPENYILTSSYAERPFYQRLLLLGIWGKISLYKYIACWLITEGACILTGLTYNGRDENGNDIWDGCANVKIRKFEGCTKFSEIIQSFNINTNRWVAQYIFKRVKFLGNKLLSQALTLMFLAIWHGLHSGYYMCFFLEFIVMKMENDIDQIIKRYPKFITFLENNTVKSIKWICMKIFVTIFMGYCLIPFVLLSFNKWWTAYSTIYFIGHIIWCSWLVISPFALSAAKHKSAEAKKE